jgi:hypothetical protein
MFLSENMSYIMRKNKHPFYFSEGITRASTSQIVGNDSIPIIDLVQNLRPKKNWKKEWEFN